MPWTPTQAKQKRTDLTTPEAKVWADVANDVLKRCLENEGTDCEAKAIRQANATINKNRLSKEGKDLSNKLEVVRLRETVQVNLKVVNRREPLQESPTVNFNANDKTFPIRIIVAGRSLNDTVYNKQNLVELRNLLMAEEVSRGVYRSRKMYIDHVKVEEDGVYTGRSIEDWAATILEAYVPDSELNALHGLVQVTPQKEYIYDLAKQQPQELGVSIHVGAIVERVDDGGDGRPATMIRQIVDVYSVDFVTEASAGGGVLMQECIGEDRKQMLTKALESATKAQNKELCGLIESINGKPLKEEAINPKTNTIIPFAVELNKQKREEEARETYWALTSYLRELIVGENSSKIPLETRITSGQDAVGVAFRIIDSLVTTGTESKEGLNADIKIKIDSSARLSKIKTESDVLNRSEIIDRLFVNEAIEDLKSNCEESEVKRALLSLSEV